MALRKLRNPCRCVQLKLTGLRPALFVPQTLPAKFHGVIQLKNSSSTALATMNVAMGCLLFSPLVAASTS